MKLPKITNCNATECAYNIKNGCHALSITVGGPGDHNCDTFCPATSKGGCPTATGMVGACKVSSCKYNKNFECTAGSVCVGHEGTNVDCMTYQKR